PSMSSRRPVFFVLIWRPPCSTLFPYTTLFRSLPQRQPSQRRLGPRLGSVGPGRLAGACRALRTPHEREEREEAEDGSRSREKGSDRKSTRLNSSHVKISYAVFCLKKKKRRRAL